MRKYEAIYLSIHFETLLRGLLGKSMSLTAGDVRFQPMRAYYVRVINGLANAVDSNVTVIDPGHRRDIHDALERAREEVGRAGSSETLQRFMVEHLMRLCFLLAGGIPSNYDKDRVTKRDWEANRSVIFAQSPVQRAAHLQAHARNTIDGPPETHKFYAALNKFVNKPIEKFRWLANKYPEVYSWLYEDDKPESFGSDDA